MKIKIHKGNWNRNYISKHQEQIFIFGDNNARIGNGGQAVIRGLSNTMGIRTKKGPSTKSVAYYKDSGYDQNCKYILEDILNIKEEALKGSVIVLSDGGYGTGLALLKEKAPKTFKYLCQSMKDHFNFDNETGRKWNKIPGYNDITRGIYISMDVNNKDILQPINNSYFRSEYLEKGLNTTFDLIKTENKVAFTSSKKYKNDDVIIFTFKGKEHIVCRVVCSYKMDLVLKDYKWYSFEGFDNSFSIAGPDPVLNDKKDDYKYQTHFEFICTLNDKGEMVFKNDIFGEKKKASPKPKKVEVKPEVKVEKNKDVVMDKKVSNEELLEVLNRIESKIDKNKSRTFFKKKSLEELVQNLGDVLKIDKIDKIESALSDNKYQIEVSRKIGDNTWNNGIIDPIDNSVGGSVFYVVIFKEGFFENKIDIIMKVKSSII